jgi:hypothetical protein
VLARFLVGDGAHLTCDVIEQNKKIVFEIGVHRPALKVCRQVTTRRLLRADDRCGSQDCHRRRYARS